MVGKSIWLAGLLGIAAIAIVGAKTKPPERADVGVEPRADGAAYAEARGRGHPVR